MFRPALVAGRSAGENLSDTSLVFRSKKSLMEENENLKLKLSERDATLSNYNSVQDDNNKLKEILGRKSEEKNMVLAAILAKPKSSPYDTLIIDAGLSESVFPGEKVFAFGSVPIGRVAEAYEHSSKIILFSNPGERTEVSIEGVDVSMQIVGRGAGNFEMSLPRDLALEAGREVNLPGIDSYVVAKVVSIISDPRDAFTKALLISPVNIQELKFVEVQK